MIIEAVIDMKGIGAQPEQDHASTGGQHLCAQQVFQSRTAWIEGSDRKRVSSPFQANLPSRITNGTLAMCTQPSFARLTKLHQYDQFEHDTAHSAHAHHPVSSLQPTTQTTRRTPTNTCFPTDYPQPV